MGTDGEILLFLTNLRIPEDVPGSQTVGAKLHWSQGQQPRSQSKVPKFRLSVKGGEVTYTTRRLA